METRVFPWWQRYGETIRETRERFLLFHPELRTSPIRYEGRLDPLAEGVILFVSPHGNENERVEREVRLLEKEYEVDALLGVRTDSGDVLGLAEEILLSPSHGDVRILRSEAEKSLVGCHMLPLPLYSSPHIRELREKGYKEGKRRRGKMCFREVQSKPLPPMERNDLLSLVERLVVSVPGDFRQREVLSRWERIALFLPERIPLISFSLRASSGSYVRSFLAELARRTKVPVTSLKIRRVKIGTWGREDCPFL